MKPRKLLGVLHGALVVLLVLPFTPGVPGTIMRADQGLDDQRFFKTTRHVKGVDYGPFREGQRPGGPCPTLEEIKEDMPILRRMANALRTYSFLDCQLGEKMLTATQGVHVTLALGLWISRDREANAREIDELQRLAAQGLQTVVAVVVGSEVLLRGNVTMDDLIGYLTQVKAIVSRRIPVTTAEPWHIWVGLDGRYPNPTPLVEAVDAIFLNIYPYWDGICVDQSVDAVFDRLRQVQNAYPTKTVMISETGWPTGGASKGCAVPSFDNQRQFLEGFLCRAQEERVSFYVFEAFDEQWKAPPEVEAHWGFYASDRTHKHLFKTLRRCPLPRGGRLAD